MTIEINRHRDIMIQVLKEIYADTTIGPVLGFKGGTAAYLFYDLSRFSVDLDFDLLDSSKEDYVFERVASILEKYGKFRDKYKKRYNLLFMISYQKGFQGLKVEINRAKSISEYQPQSFFGISMLVMNKEDMFANKLLAMTDRIGTANRDIFDVWFFLKNGWDFNVEIIKTRSGVSVAEFLEKSITALETIEENYILAGLGELLDAKQKDWVKAHLKEDALFLLRLRLDNERRNQKIKQNQS